MGKANLLILPFVLLTFIMPALFGWMHGAESLKNGFDEFFSLKIFIPVLIIGIIIHEFIHGFTWALFSSGKWKDI